MLDQGYDSCVVHKVLLITGAQLKSETFYYASVYSHCQVSVMWLLPVHVVRDKILSPFPGLF